MKKRAIILSALSLFLFSGCIPVTSANGFYDHASIVDDPALLGTWRMVQKQENGKTPLPMYFAFEKDAAGRLSAVFTQQSSYENSHKFEAVTFKSGGASLLDLFPEVEQRETTFDRTMNVAYFFHSYPVHTLSSYKVEGDTLKIGFLSIEKFKENFKGDPGKIKYIGNEERFLLTGDEFEIQGYAKDFAGTPAAFNLEFVFKKTEKEQ